MAACEIHSIYVLNGAGKPAEIRLSRQYRTDLHDGVIEVYRTDTSAGIVPEKRVASFTSLFGRNGAGKTTLLVDLCRTCGVSPKARPLGVLFSAGKRLMLFGGKPLSRWKSGDKGVTAERVESPPEIDTVFYSTSPFESMRNRNLKEYGVKNVSPAFERHYRFDGLALILNTQHLTGAAADEWQQREITVRGWITRETLPGKRVDELLQRHGYESEAGLRRSAGQLFSRWLKSIPKAEQEILNGNLKIISEVEGNGNVVGRFVGELLGIASRAQNQQLARADHGWHTLLNLSTRVIDESGFIPANGARLIQYLDSLRQALGVRTPGIRFKLKAGPRELQTALESTEKQFPDMARFATDLGFLEFTLNNLSSGQFALMYLYSAIGSALSRLTPVDERSPVFLLVDEGEMFLHPSWQREYVEGLLDFVGKFNNPLRPVHVIITTHSLIVAADSPPHSLFDVEAGEERNGFGYGPRATLGDVYGEAEFAGKHTAGMVEELVGYLRNPKAKTTKRIRKLADALADTQLQDYVFAAMRARDGGRLA